MEQQIKVCVTAGGGYIGSLLVKKLLDKGYTVHATLRNLEDKSKVGLLKSLPNANTNLVLFQADIQSTSGFESAIEGCEYVFHLATPMQHDPNNSPYKDRTEATVAGVRSIVESCIRSKSVKRVIYPATVLAASPLNEDGKSFKPCMDESCWTPFHLSFSYATDYEKEYIKAKILAEKEVLRHNKDEEDGKLEIVSLAIGLVGGETILPSMPLSVALVNSQITRNLDAYNGLKFIQELLGSIPIVHVDDVCEALIFSMENPSMKGRFICSSAYPTSIDIGLYFTQNYPEFKIDEQFMVEGGENIKIGYSSKLTEMGFVYKHDLKKILDESLKCGRRMGSLSHSIQN